MPVYAMIVTLLNDLLMSMQDVTWELGPHDQLPSWRWHDPIPQINL